MAKGSGSKPRASTKNIPQAEDREAQMKFLLAALQDAQAVIRATDSKITALSFGLALPLTKLGAIWSICSQLVAVTPGFGKFCAGLVVLIFTLAWIISFAGALRTLLHIDNPAQHIGGDRPSGVFYSAVLFQPSWVDLFFPRRLDSTAQFGAFFEKLPSSDRDVCRELAFELMKIVYIRTIKLKRAALTYMAFTVWLVSGGGIWIATLIVRNYGS